MKDQSFDICIHRPVHQLDSILHKSLVLGVSHSCREHGHVIMFSPGSEILVDDRIVSVATRDRSLQVVGNDSHRRTAEKMKGILTGRNQVFLLLRADSLAIGIMAAWKDGYENFHTLYLTRFSIHYLQFVTGIVDVHLITGKMFHMSYRLELVLVTTYGTLEVGITIAAGAFT